MVCGCTACVSRALDVSTMDERVHQILSTLDTDRAEDLKWYISYEFAPISIHEIPTSHEQLFWDALGLLMMTQKFEYREKNAGITVGSGKLLVEAGDDRREYLCVEQLRTDAQRGDPIAAVGVQLAEAMIRYIHADREDYEACYRFAGADWAVEVNLDEGVAHIDTYNKCGRVYRRYSLEEFLASQDPLVLEAREWVREELPGLIGDTP